MPIVSRVLKHVRPQRDGAVRVQEHLVDSRGRSWFHSYKIATEAAALSRMNSWDMTVQLKDADFRDLLAWVQAKNDPRSFDFTGRDLTGPEFNRRLTKRFATARFEIDSDFMRGVAPFIASKTATQVANSLGITEVRAQVILDRAVHIRDTIDVALVTDAGRAQEGIG